MLVKKSYFHRLKGAIVQSLDRFLKAELISEIIGILEAKWHK